MVHILPTRPHLRSANFGQRFYSSTCLHFTRALTVRVRIRIKIRVSVTLGACFRVRVSDQGHRQVKKCGVDMHGEVRSASL